MCSKQPIQVKTKKSSTYELMGPLMKVLLTRKYNFIWTERHYHQPTRVTLVTTSASGDSFLNRVELQNGCLPRGHSNLCIPSTLNGSPVDEDGNFQKELHKKNMDAALYKYIKRVDGAPCMKASIKLYAGCTDSPKISRRHKLRTFLRGSKKAKEDLKEEYPRLYSYL